MSEKTKVNQSIPSICAAFIGCALSILVTNWDGILWTMDFTELKVLILASIPGLTIAINKFFKYIYERYSMGAEKRLFDKDNRRKISRLREALNDPLIEETQKAEFRKQYTEAIQAGVNIIDQSVVLQRSR